LRHQYGCRPATGKAAAYSLGITRSSLVESLGAVRHRHGVETTEQAVYLLTVRGELRVEGHETA
jgi:hypothetical protein